jgi:molybdopterin converting factor small subunit
MSVVRIPPTLRAEAGGHRDVEVAAATVREALAALVDSYPALEERLPGDGRLPAFVNLYVDGKDVRELAGLETPL